MKTILITGGCGFIGTNLALHLSKDHEVICVDNLYRKGSEENKAALEDKGIKVVVCDVKVAPEFDKVDAVIHCAGNPTVLDGHSEPLAMVDSNVMSTAYALEVSRKHKAKFIFMSTSRVYSECLYGTTKIVAEKVIIEYSRMFGFPYIINRLGLTAGPYQHGHINQGLVGYWVKQHVEGGKLDYVGYGGKGRQVRDILHVEDLCYLVSKELEYDGNLNVDVGGGKKNAVSLKRLTEIVSEVTGKTIDIGCVEKTRPSDIERYVTDNSPATTETEWIPLRSVKETVRDTYKWFKERKDNAETAV